MVVGARVGDTPGRVLTTYAHLMRDGEDRTAGIVERRWAAMRRTAPGTAEGATGADQVRTSVDLRAL